jgi:threonine/homoserine/homoserine lactone efflux protein
VAPLLAALMLAVLCWLGYGIWTAYRAEAAAAARERPES